MPWVVLATQLLSVFSGRKGFVKLTLRNSAISQEAGQQLSICPGHPTADPDFAQEGNEVMRIFQWMKRAIQFVFDPEIYCLAWLAIRNQFRRRRSLDPAASQEEKKRAKAFNSQ